MARSSEKVEKVRDFLKSKGFNARQVSVRQDPCTYSVAVTATIRDLAVPYAVVKEALDLVHSTRTCEVSGEPLLGGNTYTEIRYADGLLSPLIKAREAELADLKVGEWKVIEDGKIQIDRETDTTYHLWAIQPNGCGHHVGRAWGLNSTAEAVVNYCLKGKP